MGLRINGSNGVLTTLRNLESSRNDQIQSLEQLSSGLEINQASDDPSGFAISEEFRSELESLNQAVENTERASGIVNTADSALSRINSQINSIRESAVQASNTGVLGEEQQQAIQDTVNQAISSIDRIASGTRFGDVDLLNGNISFDVSEQSDQIEDVRVRSFQSDTNEFPQTVDVEVTSPATRAEATGTIDNTQSGASEVRIEGEAGEATLQFEAGATRSEVEEAINDVSEQTGVEADNGTIQSVREGSEAEVTIEELEGDLEGISEGTNTGTDIEGTIEGIEAEGDRNTLRVSSNEISGEVSFASDTSAGSFQFEVAGGGAQFQLGTGNTSGDRIRIGIESVKTDNLGGSGDGNTLRTLQSGGANTLVNNPGQAQQIADRALDQVNEIRSDLGNTQSRVLETNQNALEEEIVNITDSESQIRDANIAEVAAENFRASLLSQASIDTLNSFSFNQGGILDLLNGSI